MKQMMTKKNRLAGMILTAVLLVTLLSVPALAAFSYQHDPMENPKAAKDIIVNPDAVYGYSPNPDSTRLGEYAALDWTDPEVVAEARANREEYLKQFERIYDLIDEMRAEGRDIEEIARAASALRNEIRLEAYKDDPEGLEMVKRSNYETYGNENGPTIEYLYEKHGSWEAILDSAVSSNPGADALVGLYDEMYDTYGLEEDDPEPQIEPIVNPTPNPNPTPAPAPAKKAPKTGEQENSLLLILLLTAAAGSAAGIAAVCSRKRNQNER